MPETLLFPDNEAKRKGRALVEIIERDVRDRAPALKTKEYIRNTYYGLKRRKLRYEGQSDIHFHVLAEKVESIVPKEMNAFFGADPHAHARRIPEEFDEKETQAIQRKVNWAVDHDIPNFYQTFESWLRNRHLDGVSILMPWYTYEERNTVIVEEVNAMWYAGEEDLSGTKVPEDRLMLPAEVLGSVFAGLMIRSAFRAADEIDPVSEQPLAGLGFVIDFQEGDVDYRNIRVEFHASRFKNKIKLYIFRPIPVKDNVEVDIIDFDDLIVPWRAKDLQSAERVTRQYWLTVSEIEQRARYNGWQIDEEDMKTLRARALSGGQEELPDNRGLKEQKDVITGVHTNRASKAVDLKPYVDNKVLIFDVYVREDLDDDGIFEEVIYQIPYALRKIVKAEYLEERFPHGRRPFPDLHSIPISNRYYSWSFGQILAPINVEINTILNSINDAQEIANFPFFFYIPLAMPGGPKMLQNIEPGHGIPVGDVNGVFFPKFNQEPLANLSAVDSLLLFADRLTVSPQASGSSQVRNAPRTARGTLALLSEASVKIDSFITAAQKGGWAELMYQIYALYEAFGSDEKWQKVTGMSRPRRSRSKDLYSRIKFEFLGNTVNTNREVSRSVAQLLYSMLAAEPLYATDMVARRNLIEFLIDRFPEVTDKEKLLPKPPQGGGTRQPLTQRAETEIMLQGVPMDVLPVDDDTQHMQELLQVMNSRRFGDFDQVQITLLASHFRQHQQQLLLKQQTGQVQAGGTQANNMPIEVGQGLGMLEGGIV